MSPKQLSVLHSFSEQALGVVVEDLVRLAFLKANGQEGKELEKNWPPSLVNRVVGILVGRRFHDLVRAVWLYPQASKPTLPGTNSGFLSYSIIKAWKMGSIRVGLD